MYSPMEVKLGKKNLGCAVKLVVYASPILCSQNQSFPFFISMYLYNKQLKEHSELVKWVRIKISITIF